MEEISAPSGTGGGHRLEMGATAGVALPIPGLLPPRSDFFPHIAGISGSLGHRNLYRGHEPILRLDFRLRCGGRAGEVLLDDRVTAAVPVSTSDM